MNDGKSQSDAGNQGVSGIRTLILQVCRLLEYVLFVLRAICRGDAINLPASPCDSCPNKQSCTNICDRLKVHLDGVQKGKLHKERTVGIDFDLIGDVQGSKHVDGLKKSNAIDRSNLGNIKRVKALNILESYEKCWDRLTPKQREVVEFHGEGKKQNEIATILGKSCSTVCALLKSANKKKEDIEKELRAEYLKQIKESTEHENEF